VAGRHGQETERQSVETWRANDSKGKPRKKKEKEGLHFGQKKRGFLKKKRGDLTEKVDEEKKLPYSSRNNLGGLSGTKMSEEILHSRGWTNQERGGGAKASGA